MEYCCHVWTGASCCYLDIFDEPQKRVSRTDGLTLAGSFEPLGRCSSELAKLVSLPYSRERSMLYSDRLFFATITRSYKDVYVNSFFSHTSRLWNSMYTECFPFQNAF